MKTDEFSDAIRRKLDSVSPPFQEKKWMQFQAFMHQSGFPPSVWQSPRQWWQPALSAAAVTGLVVMSVWQYQSNQVLNQHVQTLTQSVARLEKGQTSLQQSMRQLSQGPTRPDTVYVVQHTDQTGATTLAYTTQPPRHLTADGLAEQTRTSAPPAGVLAPTTNALATTDRFAQTQVERSRLPAYRSAISARTRNGQPADNATLVQQTPLAALIPQQGTSRTNASGQPADVVLARPIAGQLLTTRTRQATTRETVAPDVGVAPAAGTRTALSQPADQPGQPHSINPQINPTNSVATPAYDNTRYTQSASTVTQTTKSTRPSTTNDMVSTAVNEPAVAVATPSAQPERQVALVPLLTPLGMPPVSSEALDARWASHLRRVRYRSPYAPAVAAAAVPDNRPKAAAVQWRVGVGGDLTTTQSGGGANLEIVLANRWTLSAGIGVANWQGDAFQTEAQFATKTRRPFHSEYPNEMTIPAGPATPRVAVDISRTGRSVLVPLQLGYRIPGMSRSFQLTPFVGANLGVNACESVSFAIDRPLGMGKPRDTDQQQLNIIRPVAWYSSWTLGVSAERQWGHLVGQLSPFASLPLTGHEGSLNMASAGLRARVYYQF